MVDGPSSRPKAAHGLPSAVRRRGPQGRIKVAAGGTVNGCMVKHDQTNSGGGEKRRSCFFSLFPAMYRPYVSFMVWGEGIIRLRRISEGVWGWTRETAGRYLYDDSELGKRMFFLQYF